MTIQNPQIAEIEATFRKAEQLRESGDREEALKEYTRVVYFAPRHWPTYFHLGVMFGEAGHNELAVSLLSRSAELMPNDYAIRNHLADYLIKLHLDEAAMEQLKESWKLDSTQRNLSALLKIGKIFRESNRPAEAIPYFEQILTEHEGETITKETEDLRTVSRWFRALSRMSLGDYQAAWDDFEIRNNIPGVIVPIMEGEKWTGQPLDGKTIFLAFEQRFGDIIHFMRFIPKVREMGARIIVQIPPELDRLFRHSFPEIEFVLTSHPIPEFDYYQYLTSIPAVLNLGAEDTISDAIPYLQVNDSDIQPLPMRNETFLKVGFVWEGNPDPDRSIPINRYIPLLKHRNVSFYSFQLGDRRKDLFDNAVGWLVVDLGPQISDFYDSSVLLKQMDLLITIDTAIAHQAGALDIPVWLMLRFFSDWRWDLEQDSNRWYPTMRVFKQEKLNSWTEPGIKLEQAFEDWVTKQLPEKQQDNTS